MTTPIKFWEENVIVSINIYHEITVSSSIEESSIISPSIDDISIITTEIGYRVEV